MANELLAFQGCEQGPDRGVGRGIGQVVLHFLGSGLSEAVKDFENLALAPRDLPFLQSIHESTLDLCYKTRNNNVRKTA